MNIPGYYYDENKKKYFKITNGSVDSQYHNNFVEQEKRQKKLQQVDNAKQMSQSQSIKFKLLYLSCSLNNVKLGLARTSHSLIDFERLASMQLVNWVLYRGLEAKIWGQITIDDCVFVIITSQARQIQMVNMEYILNHPEKTYQDHDIVCQFYEDASNSHILTEIITRCNLLPYDFLTISTVSDLMFCNVIFESDLDNPQLYQNLIRFGQFVRLSNGALIQNDKSEIIYRFINDLPDGEIKKDLYHLFGMNLINLTGDGYEYQGTIKNFKRFFITTSYFKDGYLILGTNLGVIYLCPFQYGGGGGGGDNNDDNDNNDNDNDTNNININNTNINNTNNNDITFSQSIIKFKFEKSFKLDKINKVEKIDDYLFIISFKKLMILNISTHEKFVYSFNEIIKNFRVFKVLDNFRIIIVDYKQVLVVNFSKPFKNYQLINQYKLINDNVINQYSLISIKNTVVVNQSNLSLLVINLNNFNTKLIPLNSINQKVSGIQRVNDNYVMINMKNSDNTSYFNFYRV